MFGLKNSHTHTKISTKMVNPRDITGNAEKEEEEKEEEDKEEVEEEEEKEKEEDEHGLNSKKDCFQHQP